MTNGALVSNHEFLAAVFGTHLFKVHVCGFPGDPEDPSAARSRWAGRWYGEGGDGLLRDDWNTYYTVSTFKKDDQGRAVRTEPFFEALHVLMIDDVGTKIDAKDVPIAPTFSVETSPGNFQYGYVFKEPVKGHALASLIETRWREMVKGLAGGRDPGSGNLTRYVRPPVGVNGKAKYAGPDGAVPKCALGIWEPTRKFSAEKLAKNFLKISDQEYGDATAGTHVPGTSRPGSSAAYTKPSEDTSGWAQALHTRGIIHTAHKPGAWDMECPFVEEHTKQVNTGCAYLGDGLFKCHHGHCEDLPSSAFQNKLEEAYPGIRADAARHVFEAAPHVPDAIDGFSEEELLADVGYDLGRDPSPDDIVQKYVFLKYDDEVFDMRGRTNLKRGAFNALYAGPVARVLAAKYLNWNGKGTCPPAFDSFMQHPERMVANAKTYAPGKPSWWRDPHTISVSRNSIIVNTWAEPEIGRGRNPARTRAITPRVRQETMGLFTKLVEQLTGESGDKEFGLDWRMYNWLALMVADQATKPGWQWLIMSDPGFGKDTLAKLITPLVGEENSTMVGQDDVSSGYNAWAAKKFVVVNELSSAHDGRKKGTALFDHLKPFFTAPPDHITINPKYGKQYTAANVGGYMLFSNQSTPLLIDMGERRLCIVDRRKKPGIISKSEFARLNGIRSNPVALEVIGVWLRERFNNFTVDTLQDLVGNAPKTVAKDELLEVSAGKHEEMIADWIEDANDLGPLWTGDQLKDRLNRAAKDDRALGSMTSYQMARRLKDAGAWKVFMHGDKEGRVPGVGSNGRGRDVVWALYEKPSEGITRDAQLTPDQIRDLLTKQNAERGGGAVTAITGAIKKEAQDVLDEPEDDDAETPQ